MFYLWSQVTNKKQDSTFYYASEGLSINEKVDGFELKGRRIKAIITGIFTEIAKGRSVSGASSGRENSCGI
jgi:hypothetical protein